MASIHKLFDLFLNVTRQMAQHSSTEFSCPYILILLGAEARQALQVFNQKIDCSGRR